LIYYLDKKRENCADATVTVAPQPYITHYVDYSEGMDEIHITADTVAMMSAATRNIVVTRKATDFEG